MDGTGWKNPYIGVFQSFERHTALTLACACDLLIDTEVIPHLASSLFSTASTSSEESLSMLVTDGDLVLFPPTALSSSSSLPCKDSVSQDAFEGLMHTNKLSVATDNLSTLVMGTELVGLAGCEATRNNGYVRSS
jgi:hypothetical protein